MEIKNVKKEENPDFLSIVIVLSINLYPAAILCETQCERAEDLFQKALRQANSIEEESTLKETVSLCPQHAEAWNNLGTIYEKKGKLEKAENRSFSE